MRDYDGQIIDEIVDAGRNPLKARSYMSVTPNCAFVSHAIARDRIYAQVETGIDYLTEQAHSTNGNKIVLRRELGKLEKKLRDLKVPAPSPPRKERLIKPASYSARRCTEFRPVEIYHRN